MPRRIARYWLHGLALSFVMFFVEIAWAVLLVALVVCGSLLGLGISLLLLALFYGYVNAGVTSWLWWPVETSWKICMVQGIVLGILTLVVNLVFEFVPLMEGWGVQSTPLETAGLAVPRLDLVTSIVLLLIEAPVIGLLGRWCAGLLQERPVSHSRYYVGD
jgi:hypothetical protein